MSRWERVEGEGVRGGGGSLAKLQDRRTDQVPYLPRTLLSTCLWPVGCSKGERAQLDVDRKGAQLVNPQKG